MIVLSSTAFVRILTPYPNKPTLRGRFYFLRKHMHELAVIEAKLKLILRQIEKQPTTSYGQAYVQLRQLLSLVRKMKTCCGKLV